LPAKADTLEFAVRNSQAALWVRSIRPAQFRDNWRWQRQGQNAFVQQYRLASVGCTDSIELATISEEERLVSRIGELVETLPSPTEFPPPQIQNASRIDWPTEIRSLAITWNDALADYSAEINAGTCALYLWKDGDFSALCSVTRCERLGWFLNHVSGPQNAKIDPRQRAQIRSAFSQAGFPPFQTIAAVIVMSRRAEIWKGQILRGRSVCQH
jgi:hypothetical protein